MPPETGSADAPVVESGSTQEFDWESDDNPYKQRFNDYRPEADRRATRLSEYEQALEDLRSTDPSRQQAAAEILQIELVTEDPIENEYVDPYEELSARVEQLSQQLTQSEIASRNKDAAITVEARLDSMDLDDSDKDWVLARGIAMGAGDDGLPDVYAAYQELKARDDARIQAAMQDWQAGKRSPRSIAPGTTATEQKNTDDMTDAERVDYFTARLEDMS